MTMPDVLVIVAGVAAIGGLAWFFFKPRQAAQAKLEGSVQSVNITVKGGYSPSLIRVQPGTPVRLRFDRQETPTAPPRSSSPTSASRSRWQPSEPPPSNCPPRSPASTGAPASRRRGNPWLTGATKP